MAAADKVGFQDFPQAVYEIPPREQIEEASAIAQNLLEGQQAVGQGLSDPFTHAVHYLEKHRIVEIMQVTMETSVSVVVPWYRPGSWQCTNPSIHCVPISRRI
jgi:hypothetical protein